MKHKHTQEIARRLEALYRQHGELTPTLVVEDARDPESPLHSHFEWDDSAAAERFRRMQARRLLASVEVLIQVNRVKVATVAYVRDPDKAPREQGYTAVGELRQDAERAKAALQYELRRIAASLERARRLALALGLAKEVDSLLDEIEHLRQQAA